MRFAFVALLLSLSGPAIAVDDCPAPDPMETLQAVAKESQSWWAAGGSQVKQAPCKTKSPPRAKDMREFLEDRKSGVVASLQINGIEFEDEDTELLKTFSDLHVPYLPSLNADMKPEFKSKCRKVLCAMTEIYGEEVGLRLLYLQKRFGLSGSDLVKKNSSRWRKDELDDILTALSDYPESMFPVPGAETLVHFQRGYTRPGGSSTLANAVIEIFDRWNEQPAEERQMAIVHEMGHNLARLGDKDESPEWLALGGWKGKTVVKDGKEQTQWTTETPEKAVSKYGGTNPGEDFAETVVAYRYRGADLKKDHPEKYEYMRKNVFDGIEYTDSAACRRGTNTQIRQGRQRQALAKLLEDPAVRKIPRDLAKETKIVERLEARCRESLISSLSGGADTLQACVAGNLPREYLRQKAEQKGLADFEADVLTTTDLKAVKVDAEGAKPVQSLLKERAVRSLESDLKKSSHIFTYIGGLFSSGDAQKDCEKAGDYLYMEFDKNPGYSDLVKKDKFYFFSRRKELAAWAKKVCVDSRQKSGGENGGGAKGSALTAAVQKNIP